MTTTTAGALLNTRALSFISLSYFSQLQHLKQTTIKMSLSGDREKGSLMRRLKRLPSTLRGAKKEKVTQKTKETEEEEQQRVLYAIYQAVKDDRGDYFDARALSLNNIKTQPLPLDGEELKPASDTFFIPMTKKELDAHPLDMDDETTKKEFGKRDWVWKDYSLPAWLAKRDPSESISDRLDIAERLCALIGQDFAYVKRKDPGDGPSGILRKFTSWRPRLVTSHSTNYLL